MIQSWGYLIPKILHVYGFENFYATVIQRAYRNYKKRPESLAKRVWEAVRNDGTPDDMKFLSKIPTREYWGFGSNDFELISEKEVQLRLRLTNIAFIVSLKLLYQQGYIIIRSSNPEYYHIDKKSNSKNFVRISEYKKCMRKGLVTYDSLTKITALTQLYNPVTVDLSDLDNNSEFVRRIFQISP